MTSSDQPLHKHANTHLYHDDFNTFASDYATGDTLLVAPDGATATAILHRLNATPGVDVVETFTGDDSTLPYEPDSFETTILYNPTRGILQRHRPLYEATAVTRESGRIIYRAPNYLAHSNAADLGGLYVLAWADHADPALAACLTVTEAGDPSTTPDRPDDTPRLQDFLIPTEP